MPHGYVKVWSQSSINPRLYRRRPKAGYEKDWRIIATEYQSYVKGYGYLVLCARLSLFLSRGNKTDGTRKH